MATAFLALNYLDGGTPRVKRYLNNTLTDVGAAFGTIDSVGASSAHHHTAKNRVVNFGDEKTFYAVVGNQIYKTDDEFATWSSVHTLANISGTNSIKTGLHIVDIGGVPHMVCLYSCTANIARGVRSSDGTTWGDTGNIVVAGINASNNAVTDEIVYHNVLYMSVLSPTGTSGAIWYYDAGAGSIGSIGNAAPSVASGNCFGIWQDMLLYLRNETNGSYRVYNITSGTLSVMLVQLVASGATFAGGCRYGMFVDPATNKLICIFRHNSGWLCSSVDPGTLTITSLDSIVLPASITNLPNTAKIVPYMDVEAAPGATPTVYLLCAANGTSGTTWSMFEWHGVDSVATLVDSGGNALHALGVNPRPVGGQYSYTPNQLRLRTISRTPVFGGVRYSFTCSSADGATPVKVRGFYDPAAIEKLSQVATLTNPSHGSIDGDFNTGLIADRTTVYQVTWAAQTDGIAQGSRMKFGLDITAA